MMRPGDANAARLKPREREYTAGERCNRSPKPFRGTKSVDIPNAVERHRHRVNHNYEANFNSGQLEDFEHPPDQHEHQRDEDPQEPFDHPGLRLDPPRSPPGASP